MKKKLSVIVVHYSKSYYVVKYCIYRLFPLFYWHLYNDYNHIIGNTFKMDSYDAMERYAESLTIEKIREVQKKCNQSYNNYIYSKIEFRKRNIPYSCKKIK